MIVTVEAREDDSAVIVTVEARMTVSDSHSGGQGG